MKLLCKIRGRKGSHDRDSKHEGGGRRLGAWLRSVVGKGRRQGGKKGGGGVGRTAKKRLPKKKRLLKMLKTSEEKLKWAGAGR